MSIAESIGVASRVVERAKSGTVDFRLFNAVEERTVIDALDALLDIAATAVVMQEELERLRAEVAAHVQRARDGLNI
jgi:hypothetical protein